MFKGLMSGDDMLSLWIVLFVVTGILSGIVTGYFRTRKIQPKGFKWKIFRNEIFFATITMTIVGTAMGRLSAWLNAHGWITFNHAPAA
ncbi:MAG: fatty acid hydroxylase, partial [Sphingobium sp.]